jgi:hypothetical protein
VVAASEREDAEVAVRPFRSFGQAGLDGRRLAAHGAATIASLRRRPSAASIETQPVVRPGTPRKLFRLPAKPDRDTPVFEDATPDGRRFLLNVPVSARSSVGFHVILDWPALLERGGE